MPFFLTPLPVSGKAPMNIVHIFITTPVYTLQLKSVYH